jgi:endo-1,4-beta-xylanase
MKKYNLYFLILGLGVLVLSCTNTTLQKPATLKDALKGKFYIGTAMNTWQITGKDTVGIQVIKDQFEAVVAENCMKSGPIHPTENEYNFELPDQFVDFGVANNKFITGHCLIWHSQAPQWFFTDSLGNDVSREVMVERMKNHIYTVVGRYKGRVKGWDVVNEAIMEDGSLRNTKFLQIVGEDYIKLAFQFAHEADPDAELYYNDYNEWNPGKRDAVVKMVNDLKAEGIRVDGIGMQGHIGMDSPSLEEYEAAIIAYGATGAKVMVTELDMSILPNAFGNTGADIATNFEYQQSLNPYTEGVPVEKMEEWDNRMLGFFQLFLKHSDAVSRVTLWGVSDATSWKNNFPVRGRTDYPLFFDRNYQPKSIVAKLIEEAGKPEYNNK